MDKCLPTVSHTFLAFSFTVEKISNMACSRGLFCFCFPGRWSGRSICLCDWWVSHRVLFWILGLIIVRSLSWYQGFVPKCSVSSTSPRGLVWATQHSISCPLMQSWPMLVYWLACVSSSPIVTCFNDVCSVLLFKVQGPDATIFSLRIAVVIPSPSWFYTDFRILWKMPLVCGRGLYLFWRLLHRIHLHLLLLPLWPMLCAQADRPATFLVSFVPRYLFFCDCEGGGFLHFPPPQLIVCV